MKVNNNVLPLFQNCLLNLSSALRDINGEVVICDFNSTDWNPMRDIPQLIPDLPVKVIKTNPLIELNRGMGRNLCAGEANGKYLMFLDADVIINHGFLVESLQIVYQNYAFFPVIDSALDVRNNQFYQRWTGFGNSLVAKKTWEVCSFPEYYNWGREDDDFYFKVSKQSPVLRKPIKGVWHQWHPENSNWKNKYRSKYFNKILKKVKPTSIKKEILKFNPIGKE